MIIIRIIKMCKAPGCNKCKPGQTHYCYNCKNNDSNHRSNNCPSLKPITIGWCKAPGCNKCKPGQTHYCYNCKNNDSNHRSNNCPSLK